MSFQGSIYVLKRLWTTLSSHWAIYINVSVLNTYFSHLAGFKSEKDIGNEFLVQSLAYFCVKTIIQVYWKSTVNLQFWICCAQFEFQIHCWSSSFLSIRDNVICVRPLKFTHTPQSHTLLHLPWNWSLSLEIMCMYLILSGPHTYLHLVQQLLKAL